MKKVKLKSTVKMLKTILMVITAKSGGKAYIALTAFLAIVKTVPPLALTVLPGLIITELTEEVRVSLIVSYVAVLLAVPVVTSFITTFLSNAIYEKKLSLNLQMEESFYTFCFQLDYESMEKPDIMVARDRAERTLQKFPSGIEQLVELISAMISFGVVSSIIISLNPFIVLFIVATIAINSIISKKYNEKLYGIGRELSRYDNYQGAYSYMLTQFDYAKEVRIFGIWNYLISVYADSKIKSNKMELKYFKTKNKPSLVYAITNLTQQAVLYTYLVASVVKHIITIGSMTICLAAAQQFATSLGQVFSSYVNLANMNLDIEEYLNFLKTPSKQRKMGNIIPKFKKGSVIEFKNVWFKYPGSDIYALKNVNLTIKEREKLCIVGMNGSGKSTLIKLLMRLYFPTEGEILLNGININCYDYSAYQRLFAPVFQDFANYHLTIGENITFSKEYDLEKLNKICKQCGLMELLEKLPKGYETQVGKWIDESGIDPSGGEEQRIAIARARYRDGYVFVLDEPTAALDPFAEYEIYSQFNSMTENKTAIFITHRLSAVKLADAVVVFDNGELKEYGTHGQLYAKNGIYKEMFDKQAEFYREKSV